MSERESDFCPLLVRPPTRKRTKMDEKTRKFTKKTQMWMAVENTPILLKLLILLRKDWRRGPGSNRRIKVLQTSPLPLGYRALGCMPQREPGDKSRKAIYRVARGRPDWSGRRDLNSRPSPWQGDALPLSYSRLEQVRVYRAGKTGSIGGGGRLGRGGGGPEPGRGRQRSGAFFLSYNLAVTQMEDAISDGRGLGVVGNHQSSLPKVAV